MTAISAISIGMTIKTLRKKRGLTQEQLAEYLGVTSRAVSQWERGRTAPDIAQLPILANIFEVSTDVLLGIDTGAKEKKITAALREAENLASRGYGLEAAELLRPRLKEYPDSCRLMKALMDALFKVEVNLEGAAKKETIREMIRLGEKILETCTDDDIRHNTVQTLCIIYPEAGETDKALALAGKMPTHHCDMDSLLELIYSSAQMGEERFRHIRYEFENLLYLLQTTLCFNNAPFRDGTHPYTQEEMLLLREKYFAVMEIFFEDKKYGFYSCWLSARHFDQARAFAQLNRFDQAMIQLQAAADLAAEHDTRFDPKTGSYSCLLLRGQKYGAPSYGSPENCSMEMLKKIQDKLYDPIRRTDSFVKMEAQLKKTAKLRE